MNVAVAQTETDPNAAANGDIFGFGSVDNIKSRLASNEKSGSIHPDMASLVRPRDTTCIARDVKWGMTINQVKKTENARLVNARQTVLSYRKRLGDAICLITYTFSGGALQGIRFEVHEPVSNPAGYYKEFEDVSVQLCKTGGVPSTKEYRWTDDTYRSDRSKWGKCIAEGALSCHLQWETPKARISLASQGSGDSFTTTIAFSPN